MIDIKPVPKKPTIGIDYIKSISFFVIPYFFVCAIIYHMAFWSTFNINALSYIGITDIIKSFVYPIMRHPIGYIAAIIAVFRLYTDKEFIDGKIFVRTVRSLKRNKDWLGAGFIIWLFIVIGLYAILPPTDTTIAFAYSNLLTLGPLVALLVSRTTRAAVKQLIPFLNSANKSALIYIFVYLIVMLPCFSLSTGKCDSMLIEKNREYQYTLFPNKNTNIADTIKLLGNTGQHYFFTDLQNRQIVMLRSEKVDTLILHTYKANDCLTLIEYFP